MTKGNIFIICIFTAGLILWGLSAVGIVPITDEHRFYAKIGKILSEMEYESRNEASGAYVSELIAKYYELSKDPHYKKSTIPETYTRLKYKNEQIFFSDIQYLRKMGFAASRIQSDIASFQQSFPNSKHLTELKVTARRVQERSAQQVEAADATKVMEVGTFVEFQEAMNKFLEKYGEKSIHLAAMQTKLEALNIEYLKGLNSE